MHALTNFENYNDTNSTALSLAVYDLHINKYINELAQNRIAPTISNNILYLTVPTRSKEKNEELFMGDELNPMYFALVGKLENGYYASEKKSIRHYNLGEIGCVILDQVINTLDDPRKFYINLLSLLSPGCIICVDVLDFNDAQNFEKGSNAVWSTWYFNKSTLKRFMQLSGCSNVNLLDHKSLTPADQKSICAVGIRKKSLGQIQILDVIMPVYNEKQYVTDGIKRVLAKKVDNLEIRLIIVESNSTDGTRDLVLEFATHPNVTLVMQDAPRGKGNAVRDGLRHSSGDFILIQDADNEYDIEDYDSLLRPLLSAETSFVLGARHGGKAWKMRHFENQQLTSHFLNFGHVLFTFLVNIFYGLKLKDPFTMYKIFRSDCLTGIEFVSNRFDFDYELLIKLTKAGYMPVEIPVNYRSRSFVEGKKVSMIRDPLTWIWAIIKFKF